MKLFFIEPPLINASNEACLARGELAAPDVAPFPNLGIAYLVAVAEQLGHQCRVVDMNVSPGGFEQKVLGFSPDILFLTALTTQYRAVKIIINTFKGRIPIVLGGPHASIFEERLLDDGVDIVVVGEGEETLRSLLARFPDQLGSVPGVIFKKEGQVVKTGRPERVLNLDDLPFPAWHHYHLDLYDNMYGGRKCLPVISSRGCPFHCVYCFKGVFGDKIRMRSAANVVEEIMFFKNKYDIGAVLFCDDLFTVKRKRVEEFCHLLLEKKMDIIWRCLGRADQVDYDLLSLMKKAGCRSIALGIESGNQEVLDKVGKRISLKRVAEAIQACRRVGIVSKGYYIIGLPWDTHKTVQDTINFAKKNRTTQSQFTLPLAYPGTELWDIGKQKGLPVEDYVETFSWDKNLPPYSFSDDLSEKDIEYYIRTARRIDAWAYVVKRLRKMKWQEYPGFIKWICIKSYALLRAKLAMMFRLAKHHA